jgi:hypothetical protein
MTMPSAIPERATSHAHPFTAGVNARVLATALAHLLDRDDGCPARWHTHDFASAVEAVRSELRAVAGTPATSTKALDPGREIGFDEAAARLARDPVDVAAALVHLESMRQERLPAWRDLVRRGLPRRTADLDVALWFG